MTRPTMHATSAQWKIRVGRSQTLTLFDIRIPLYSLIGRFPASQHRRELLVQSSLCPSGTCQFLINPGEEKMKFVVPFVIAAAALAAAAPASAQFAKPEDAIKYRQSALFVMAQHFGRIGAMVN